MPKWITAVFVFFLSTTLLTAKAITVEDIINKHIEAVHVAQGTTINDASAFLRDHSLKGCVAVLQGVEKVNNRNCYKIRLQNKVGFIADFFIDAESWYIIRKVFPEPAEQQSKVEEKIQIRPTKNFSETPK